MDSTHLHYLPRLALAVDAGPLDSTGRTPQQQLGLLAEPEDARTLIELHRDLNSAYADRLREAFRAVSGELSARQARALGRVPASGPSPDHRARLARAAEIDPGAFGEEATPASLVAAAMQRVAEEHPHLVAPSARSAS